MRARSAHTAQRLGWSITKFNRKLDNVADKLDRLAVGGLRGGSDSHAMNRLVCLVEYAIFSKLVSRRVSRTDLYLLDEEFVFWNATPQKATVVGILGGGQEGSR